MNKKDDRSIAVELLKEIGAGIKWLLDEWGSIIVLIVLIFLSKGVF